MDGGRRAWLAAHALSLAQLARVLAAPVSAVPRSRAGWKRRPANGLPSVYDLRDDAGTVLRTVRQDPHPGNGHFSIWTVDGETTVHWSTLRDAKAFVERTSGAGGAEP